MRVFPLFLLPSPERPCTLVMHSNDEGDSMRQIALKIRFSALKVPRSSPGAAQGLGQWNDIEGWRRWFLPSDFWLRVESVREESLDCRKYLTESLKVSERRKVATVKVGDAQNYRRDLDYLPEEFKNRRVTFVEDEERITCGRCREQGRIDCSPEMPCPNCKGRRTRKDYCFSCGGSGRSGRDGNEECWTCGGRGIRSEGCAACADVYSGSTGRVRCGRCGGTGWVVCRRCAGAGVKVRANLVIRRYRPATEVHYRLGGLEVDRFRCGLAPKHFGTLPGNLVSQETLTPLGATVALQRSSEFSYGVEVRTFRYKGAEFYLNRIDSAGETRLVASNLPWSKPRLALAGFLGAIAVCAPAALLLAN